MAHLLVFLVGLVQPVPESAPPAEILPTVAEKSDYRATARHEEVVAFCASLAELADVVRVGEMGKTVEGRRIPLLILSDPPISSAEEARAGGKLIVFALGNIHAGEVCGKEALLMLARRIALTPSHPLLKDLIIVFAPIFNADGNERVSKDNRPGQVGPQEGMGRRYNAQNLDLNRDHVKLESPEVQALAWFYSKWDPAVVIDTHTTNGSNHQYTITYDAPRHPAGDSNVIEFTRDTMLPEVSRRLQAQTGYMSFFYGNFNRADRTRWETYPPCPRYSIPYVGLRNRIGILSEGYAYATYRDRVLATRDFVRICLEYAAENRKQIVKLIKSADKATTEAGKNPRDDDLVAVRTAAVPFDKPVVIKGYVEEQRNGRWVATDKTRDYELEHHGLFEPALSVRRPFAYLLPASMSAVVEKLQQHGIKVDELREDIELDVEVYRVDELKRAQRAFQGHHLVTVEVSASKEPRRVEAGTVMVRTGQPQGSLAVCLLEPQSEDGLVTWNFFDDALAEGGDFPVMRLMSPVPITHGPVRPLKRDRTFDKPFTYDVLFGQRTGPNLRGSSVSGLTWLEDGEHFLQVKDGRLRRVDALTGRSEPFHDPDKMAQALGVLPTMAKATAKRMAQRRSFSMNADRTAALFEHENDLYYARFDGSKAVRLTSTPQREFDYSFSPDGRFVAFTRDYDVYVVEVATQNERALTTGGSELIRYGRADWVYYEEVFNRRWRTYWWSPNSSHIALLQIDDTPVREFTIVDHMPTRGREEVTRYPKAGDPNPDIRLGIVSIAGSQSRWADLGEYNQGDFLITHVGWNPDGRTVYFYVQDRAQTWLDFNTVPAQGGRATRLFRETTQAWVDNPGDAHFLKDGTFLLTSERTGWNHLYHFDANGKLKGAVTSGEWEVRRVNLVDEGGGWVYFSGTKDSHIAGNLYRVRLDGTGLERLTTSEGTHSVSVSPNGKHFIDSSSSHQRPRTVNLYRTDGSHARTIDTNPVYAIEEYRFGEFELVQIETKDGFKLEGSLLLPPGLDPGRKYPVWFMTYAGPHAPTVRDSWRATGTWDQMLAQMGIVVFRCDPRSASGKGGQSAWTAYRQLGVQELKDIEEALQWLIDEHPYVDASRIGISGHSYGGFMTAYALTHSKMFAAGIAASPLTDWRNYDTIYTERYMNTPQENPEGYRVASALKAAEDLHGRLLLIHGAMDDNVHMQNTLQMVRKLQKADKDFEMMIYPESGHGIWGAHYRRTMVDFIRRTMQPSASPQSGAR